MKYVLHEAHALLKTSAHPSTHFGMEVILPLNDFFPCSPGPGHNRRHSSYSRLGLVAFGVGVELVPLPCAKQNNPARDPKQRGGVGG